MTDNSSMEFNDRIEQATVVASAVKKSLWEHASISPRIVHVDYGAENFISREVHSLIRFVRTPTVRYVRFAPDALIVDRAKPSSAYMLDYKCTQTPLYSQNRIGMIKRASSRHDIDWPDIGQIEAEAFDNYVTLTGSGVRVAILNYCAYHPEPLLCEFVENIQVLHRDTVTTDTRTGSRTPFVNFDLYDMRSLNAFLCEEHGVSEADAAKLCEPLVQQLKRSLPVKHHYKSPLYRG